MSSCLAMGVVVATETRSLLATFHVSLRQLGDIYTAHRNMQGRNTYLAQKQTAKDADKQPFTQADAEEQSWQHLVLVWFCRSLSGESCEQRETGVAKIRILSHNIESLTRNETDRQS